jgi:hypothetical protein
VTCQQSSVLNAEGAGSRSLGYVFFSRILCPETWSRGHRPPGLALDQILRAQHLSSIPLTSAVQCRVSMHVRSPPGGSPPQYVSATVSAFDEPRLQPRRSRSARYVDYVWARETRLHTKTKKRTLARGVGWSVDITVTLGRDRDRDRDRPVSGQRCPPAGSQG